MSNDSFFDEQTDQSRVKAAFVLKYFLAWSTIMVKGLRRSKIAFIDLFSGPGYYEDGNKSVPLLIVEKAIELDYLRANLVTLFNDQNEDYTDKLRQKLVDTPNLQLLKHQPKVFDSVVGSEFTDEFNRLNLVPSLVFLDPWGYTGLSLDMINSILRHQGCECIVFFNYNRINAAISNPLVKNPMSDLFGEDRAGKLQVEIDGMDAVERERKVVEEFSEALKEKYGKFVLPFKFKFDQHNRTSHYIIFVTKHQKGYEIMKDVMANDDYVDVDEDEVPSFTYVRPNDASQGTLSIARPFLRLGDSLCSTFAGRTLTMVEVFEQHNVGEPFLKKHYKRALRDLENQNRIVVTSSTSMRRKGTFADHLTVSFPEQQSNG